MFNFLKKMWQKQMYFLDADNTKWYALCGQCKEKTHTAKLTRFGWRYQHKSKRYLKSGKAMVMTGYKFVCPKCLDMLTK